MGKLTVSSSYIGGSVTKSVDVPGGHGIIAIDSKEQNKMAGSDRPAGMDSVPRTFNVDKKEPTDQTDMGKIAKIAHVERPDRGVKGVSSSDKGGGRK